jgi:hypothetical protein
MFSIFLLVPVFFTLTSITPTETIFEFRHKEKRRSDRGIYITAAMSKTSRYFNYIKRMAKKSKINTIVIDAKRDLEPPVLALIKERKLDNETGMLSNPWLTKLTKKLHDEGFIVTARIVVFKDDHLALARPDLAIKLKGRQYYFDRKWGRWVDPYSSEVRLYNKKIAEIAALSGVDEVQFDYIRFPAEGNAYRAIFPYYKEGVSRVDTINTFLAEARECLDKYNVSIGVDIFGVTAWQMHNDVETLGQDLKKMAKYIDVLSPMFYPSHFHSGYDGIKEPGAHPYYFLNTGVKKTKKLLASDKVKIVPWIQGFNMNSPNFGPWYVAEQVRACRAEGVHGFLVWNAANNYEATFSAFKKK